MLGFVTVNRKLSCKFMGSKSKPLVVWRTVGGGMDLLYISMILWPSMLLAEAEFRHLFEMSPTNFPLWNISLSSLRVCFQVAIWGNSRVLRQRCLCEAINQCLSDSILNDNLVIFNVTPEESIEALFLPQYRRRWINWVNWNFEAAKAIGSKPTKHYAIKSALSLSSASSPSRLHAGDVSITLSSPDFMIQ